MMQDQDITVLPTEPGRQLASTALSHLLDECYFAFDEAPGKVVEDLFNLLAAVCGALDEEQALVLCKLTGFLQIRVIVF